MDRRGGGRRAVAAVLVGRAKPRAATVAGGEKAQAVLPGRAVHAHTSQLRRAQTDGLEGGCLLSAGLRGRASNHGAQRGGLRAGAVLAKRGVLKKLKCLGGVSAFHCLGSLGKGLRSCGVRRRLRRRSKRFGSGVRALLGKQLPGQFVVFLLKRLCQIA